NITVDSDQDKIFGDDDPQLTFSADNFGFDDDLDVFSGNLIREAGENVGVYPISQGDLNAGINYDLTFTGADFTIKPRQIIIFASENQSKIYGEDDPELTFTVNDRGYNDAIE